MSKLEKFVKRFILITAIVAILGILTIAGIGWIVFTDLSNGNSINWALIRTISAPFVVSLIAETTYAVFSILSIFKEEE